MGSESAVVPLATSFLTCIAQDAIGVILIALDSTQTPFAYNWVEGIDVVASDGEVYPPLAKTEDNAMAESQLIEDGQRLGNFGACYVVKEAFETATSRVMCSSNAGLGLFELVLPIEIGYCESSWTSVSAADDGTVNAESCKRFAPVCPECAGVGNKPLVGFIADSDTTNRNDGLNCNPTLLDVPEPPRTNQTAPPTPAPSPAPSPEPTKKQKCGLREKKDKKRYCWGHKGLFDRPYKSFGDGVLQIKMEGSRFKSTTSWHWWGVLEMPQSGKIKFKTTSGDSSQVWLFDEGEGLDGEQPDTSGATLIVDNTDYRRWGSTKSVESDWIQVEEGEKRVIHIFYGQKRRNTNMILRWKFQNSFYKSTLKPFFPCSDK